jgi:hypothetical protein
VRRPDELRADDGPDAGWPDLAHLCMGEQLLIWALRVRLSRGPSGPVRGFHLAFGLSGVEAALASFEAVFGLLQRHCLCDIGMHAPRCRCVSTDEMTLASVIAAFQAGAPWHAHALAARLIDASVIDGFLGHARDLAVSLKAQRLYLPVRPLVGHGGSQSHTVH